MEAMISQFTENAVKIIGSVPRGKVLTYGRVAELAGNKRSARQVSRLLHSMSSKYDLPWHRIINASGRISLKKSNGYELQKALLESEGVQFGLNDAIDLEIYLWEGG